MDLRKCRDTWYLIKAILFCWLYFPHFLCVCILCRKENIRFLWEDVKANMVKLNVEICRTKGMKLLYLLHNNAWFRTLFYYRIGPVASLLIGWYRPGDKYFILSKTMKMKGGFRFAHPYATILNAERIGQNFSCIHCTTLGDRPVIGDCVSLGANVTIIGPVRVGNNVKVGAGCVVVKDIPDNCVVVGNPARMIRENGIRVNKTLV